MWVATWRGGQCWCKGLEARRRGIAEGPRSFHKIYTRLTECGRLVNANASNSARQRLDRCVAFAIELVDASRRTLGVKRKEGMKMTRVRVEGFTISLDGYGAGPNQDIRNPLGVGGTDLHQWLVPTRTFQRTLFGADGGTTGIDADFAARGVQNVGAWILVRTIFGPIRGSWPDMNWKDWWGDNPPYHVPTFILTHHARPPIQMEGDTTFHFITGGIREALDRAREAAAGMDVRIGGGPGTIQQYLREGLPEEMTIALQPC